jgi:hypothetical protein
VLATNLTGTFKNPDGAPVNGKLIFLLSQPARLNDQSAQIVPMVKIFAVTNGQLEAGAFVYGNDILVPTGTHYLARLVDLNNNLLFEQKWVIAGVNLDLGTLTPTTTGVVLPDPLLKNASINQAVQGPVSFSAPLTAFSLTLNGNLNPGAPDSFNLGSSTVPWQELFASRWSSLVTVGNSSGTSLAPTAAPGAAAVLSGGSIADGTYYFKITYANRNGETTASPTRTVTVSGGGGAARINVGEADQVWGSGTYCFKVYASTDNVNFYLQTPNPVSSAFMATSTCHYVALGSFGARLTSLTFSGSNPPTSNTATIDPLQVALNQTRDPAYATGNTLGALLVTAKSGGHILTTPLIVFVHDCIIGTGSGNLQNTGQSRITSTWTDDRLATVMVFGQESRIEGIEVFGAGHALMYLMGAGTQGFEHWYSRGTIYTSDNTQTYSGLVIVGIGYNMHFDQFQARGGKAVVEFRNASGGLHRFSNARWDADKSILISDAAVTDPDNGVNDAGFGSVLYVTLDHIRTEGGKGILFDVVNMSGELNSVVIADPAIQSGTDSVFKTGQNAYVGNLVLPWTFVNTYLPATGNLRVGANVTGGHPGFVVMGNSSLGAGASSGQNITLDLNNAAVSLLDFYITAKPGASSTLTPHFDPTATTGKIINMPASQQLHVLGGAADQGVSTKAWNEIMDRLVIASSAGRASRQSLFMNGTTLELRQADDSTYNWQVSATGDLNLRGNLRLQATGGAAPQLSVGPAVSTAAGGSIAIINQGSLQARNAANSADVMALQVQNDDTVHVGTTNAQGVRIGNSGSSPIKRIISATATLDFGTMTAPGCASDLAVTAVGAAVGDTVSLGVPSGSVPAGVQFFAWVSAADTVTIRACAFAGSPDPANGSFRVAVVKF